MSLQILCACEKRIDSSVTTALPPEKYADVAYGADPQQKMDIDLPAGRSASATKCIVMIHGGAWTSGDKSDFNAYVDTFERRLPDYAIFNINYRLATSASNHFPTQENDVKSAIAFITSKTSQYQISDKMVLMGASAGGHLALLESYKYGNSTEPKAVVDFFGPTDMTRLYNDATNYLSPTAISMFIGATPSTDSQLYYQSSPINFVSSQSAPTIIFQGGADPLVSSSQSQILSDKLDSFGVQHQYVFYPSAGHGWYGTML